MPAMAFTSAGAMTFSSSGVREEVKRIFTGMLRWQLVGVKATAVPCYCDGLGALVLVYGRFCRLAADISSERGAELADYPRGARRERRCGGNQSRVVTSTMACWQDESPTQCAIEPIASSASARYGSFSKTVRSSRPASPT